MRNLLAIILISTLFASSDAFAERRVALVIGNSFYQTVTALSNATNDASLVASAIRKTGINDVTIALNQSRSDLSRTLRDFAEKADEADWAIVYYAGHGIEIEGKNYLIPTDAALKRDRDVPFEAIGLDEVLRTVENTKAISVVFLDACRNNPFEASMKTKGVKRSVSRGLSRVEPTGAVAVVYAAKEGTVAADGDSLNSPFATAVADHIVTPGVEINMTFRRIRQQVLEATGREQEPFVYGSLPPTEFFFSNIKALKNDGQSADGTDGSDNSEFAALASPSDLPSDDELVDIESKFHFQDAWYGGEKAPPFKRGEAIILRHDPIMCLCRSAWLKSRNSS